MKNMNIRVSSSFLAIAIIIAGFFIYKGLKSFSDKERAVTVKGLSERTVEVDYANLTIRYAIGGNNMEK